MRSTRTTLAIVLAVVVAGLGAVTVAERVSAAANHEVVGTDFAWTPDVVQAAVGDTVTWSNEQGFHNVVVDGERLNAPGFPDDAAWETNPSKTFDAAGTYQFVCEVHPTMAGSVIVGGGGGEPTPTPTPEYPPDPGGAAGSDTVAPTLDGVALTGEGGRAAIAFTLSETATVTARFTASDGMARTLRAQAAAGARTISRALPAGAYDVALVAVDAWGNTSATFEGEVTVDG